MGLGLLGKVIGGVPPDEKTLQEDDMEFVRAVSV